MVGHVTGDESQASTHVLLVLRMNIRRLANIVDDGNTRSAQRSSFHLTFLHLHPVTILHGTSEVRELHEEEREVALGESSSPVLNERDQCVAVDVTLAPASFRFP